MNTEDFDRLSEIKDEMRELFDEAERILRAEGGFDYDRAQAYWLGYMKDALYAKTQSFPETLHDLKGRPEEEEEA